MLRDFLWGALYAAVAVLIAAGGLLWYSLGMPGQSHDGPLPQATAEEIELAARLKQHVAAIASEPHNIEHYASLEKAAQYIERTLEAEGYRVVPQPYEVAGSCRPQFGSHHRAGGKRAGCKNHRGWRALQFDRRCAGGQRQRVRHRGRSGTGPAPERPAPRAHAAAAGAIRERGAALLPDRRTWAATAMPGCWPSAASQSRR